MVLSALSQGAETSTLLLGLKSTFREKLEWLEAAETLTLRLRQGRKPRRSPRGLLSELNATQCLALARPWSVKRIASAM